MSTDELPGEAALRAFEAGGRRVLIHLMKFKQALSGHLGVRPAFEAYKGALSVPDTGDLCLKRVASLRSVAEGRGGAFYETEPAGETFVVEPPTVIGAGNHRPLDGVARS